MPKEDSRSHLRSLQRWLVNIRARYPLLFLLAPFLAGQVTISIGYFATAVFMLTYVIFCYIYKAPSRAALINILICVVGALSVSLNLPPPLSDSPDYPLLGIVEERPRFLRPGSVQFSIRLLESDGTEGQQTVNLHSKGARINCVAIDLPWKNAASLKKGDLFAFRAEIMPLRGTGIFTYDRFLQRRGYSGRCRLRYTTKSLYREISRVEHWYENFLERMRRNIGSSERVGLLLSISLGVRDQISDRSERAFRRTGLSHLLVLSGYQVTLLFFAMQRILFFILIRLRSLHTFFSIFRLSSLFGLFFTLSFVLVIAPEISSVRAIIAALIVVISKTFERGKGFFHSLQLSLLILSIIWPGCYFEVGVQLTFAALIGIGLALNPSQNGAQTRGMASYLRISLLAYIFTSVVVAIWFRSLSTVGLFTNILLAPLITFFGCTLGIVGLGLYALHLDAIALPILELSMSFLEFMREVVISIAEWPGSYVEF